jgi:site-specific DNA recombinase
VAVRTALYLRVSKKEQQSLPDQQRKARAWCASRDWEVVQVFEDHGISAFSGKDRPGWTALGRAVEAREVDAVVVFQISRSARNVGRLHQFVQQCQEADVLFASVSEGFDTSTPMGRAMIQVIGALAELESELRKDRTNLGLETLRLEGRWTGRRPFGFAIDDGGKLVVDEDEGALVRECADRFLAGAGLRTIARDWNERGIYTPRRGDKTGDGEERNAGLWRANTLRDMISAPRHGGTTMTKKDHRRVLAKLEKQAERYSRRGERYLLSGGLIICGRCGGRMLGRPDNGQANYICQASGPVHLRIVAGVVDALVTRRAAEVEAPATEGVADPTGPLLAERDRIEAAMEALGASDLPEAVLRGRALRLQAELEDVERRIDELPPPDRRYGPHLLEDMEEPTRNEWREAIETVVERVEIGPARAGGQRAPSSEARVRIVWKEGVRELPPTRTALS